MTLSIKTLILTIICHTQHFGQGIFVLSVVMLSVIFLSADFYTEMQSVVMQSVVMLSVVLPNKKKEKTKKL
jgi:hypothetical protein